MIDQILKSEDKGLQHQKIVKSLSDDELMDLHLLLIDPHVHNRMMGVHNHPFFIDAVNKEIRKRIAASGMFWRRWYDKDEHRKWQIHSQMTEIISVLC